MYILDSKRFHRVLKESGFRSIGKLAKSLGVHRNTIHYYLSGRGVFPEGLEKIIQALNLKPHDILIDEKGEFFDTLENIAPIIDRLQQEFPAVTFILFGSRSRGSPHKYSDWDIGVFSGSGLPHKIYRQIVRRKNDLAEDLPFFVEIVNFNRADSYFLHEASKDWKFLAGRLNDWIALQRKAAA